MRRFVLAVSIVTVAMTSVGCYFDNVYFDFIVEVAIGGSYERVMCWEFPSTPLEVMGGPTYFGGQIFPPDGFGTPKKINTRVEAYDADNTMLGRFTHKFPVDDSGQFGKQFNLNGFEVPEGGSVCFWAQAKNGMIYDGSRVVANWYTMDVGR